MDEDDRADDGTRDAPHKASKRDRFKGALARTRSKFKKQEERSEETEHILSDDVNDFLSAGRSSISSANTASVGPDALPYHPTPRADRSTVTPEPLSSRPSTSDSSSFTHPKQSPRKLNVPRIDVSNSQRYPGAQPVGTASSENLPVNDFLRPEYQNRSLSTSSLSKGKRRSRGLSVTFIEAPPDIIGIGGDDAPAPPVEISKARARARSVSPMRNRTQANDPGYPPDRSPYQPTNGQRGLPSHGPRPGLPDILKPRALQRIETGLSPVAPVGISNLDKEFEMTLQLFAGTNSPASSTASPATPEILAPRPIRPVQPPPAVMEVPEPDTLNDSPSGPSPSNILAPKPVRPVRGPPAVMEVPDSDTPNKYPSGDAREAFQTRNDLRLYHNTPNRSNIASGGGGSILNPDISPLDQQLPRWT